MDPDKEEPLSLKALARELRGFGLGETCEKAEEMYASRELNASELFECFTAEYERRTNAGDLLLLNEAVTEVVASGNNEVLDLGNWYILQKPSEGLEILYLMLRDLSLEDTRMYLLLTANIFVIQNELNVKMIYDFFSKNGGDAGKLDKYFRIWKSAADGSPDIVHIKNAIILGNYSFIGDRALKVWDDTGFSDSFNIDNFTKMCNTLEMKIRLLSFLGHYHLVMREIGM